MLHILLILAAMYLITRFALGIAHFLFDLAFVAIVILLVVKFFH